MLDRKAIWLAGIILANVLLGTVVTVQAEETVAVAGHTAAAEVGAIIPVSLHLVDEAITVLSQEWSGMSQAERDTFLQLYDPAGTGEVDAHFVVEVLGNYHKIRAALGEDVEVIYAATSDSCEGMRLYYTDLLRLYVCPYFFEEENELRKARTLIHEVAHMALLVTDRPYYRPTSKQYAELTPNGSWVNEAPVIGRVLREVLRGDTLFHPDAYAHYALMSAGYTNIYAHSQ